MPLSEAPTMPKSQGFIRYQIRSKRNVNIEYGTFCVAKWDKICKKNDETWLGRVINKEEGIFYTKILGYYKFKIPSTFEQLSEKESEKYIIIDKAKNLKLGRIKNIKINQRPNTIHLGLSYVINKFILKTGLDKIIPFGTPKDKDSILSLINYKIASNDCYCDAYEWWESDFCRYLYPYADLKQQIISELLAKIGTEKYFRNFFDNYLHYLDKININNNVLIDGTGLKNTIDYPLSPVNNHNGIISNEIILMSVIDRITGLPIYYRYVPGNIVDINTLKKTINELLEYNIQIHRLILDAGYYSEENIAELIALNIPFMTRMHQKNGTYEVLIKQIGPNLQKNENLVKYNHRNIFVKKVQIKIFNSQIPVTAFVCCDPIVKADQYKNYYKNFDNNIDNDKFDYDLLNMGMFIIVTTIDVSPEEVLPCYYSRQSVEQLFDYIKNTIDTVPLRVQSEETFSGHIMLCFLATIIYHSLDIELRKSGIIFFQAKESLLRLHGNVYNKNLIPDVANKLVNDVLKALKIKLDAKILLDI
jgi:hypothetical protein